MIYLLVFSSPRYLRDLITVYSIHSTIYTSQWLSSNHHAGPRLAGPLHCSVCRGGIPLRFWGTRHTICAIF